MARGGRVGGVGVRHLAEQGGPDGLGDDDLGQRVHRLSGPVDAHMHQVLSGRAGVGPGRGLVVHLHHAAGQALAHPAAHLGGRGAHLVGAEVEPDHPQCLGPRQQPHRGRGDHAETGLDEQLHQRGAEAVGVDRGRAAGFGPPADPDQLTAGQDGLDARQILRALVAQAHTTVQGIADDAGVRGGGGHVHHAFGAVQEFGEPGLAHPGLHDGPAPGHVDVADPVEAGQVEHDRTVPGGLTRAQSPVASGAEGVQRGAGPAVREQFDDPPHLLGRTRTHHTADVPRPVLPGVRPQHGVRFCAADAPGTRDPVGAHDSCGPVQHGLDARTGGHLVLKVGHGTNGHGRTPVPSRMKR